MFVQNFIKLSSCVRANREKTPTKKNSRSLPRTLISVGMKEWSPPQWSRRLWNEWMNTRPPARSSQLAHHTALIAAWTRAEREMPVPLLLRSFATSDTIHCILTVCGVCPSLAADCTQRLAQRNISTERSAELTGHVGGWLLGLNGQDHVNIVTGWRHTAPQTTYTRLLSIQQTEWVFCCVLTSVSKMTCEPYNTVWYYYTQYWQNVTWTSTVRTGSSIWYDIIW